MHESDMSRFLQQTHLLLLWDFVTYDTFGAAPEQKKIRSYLKQYFNHNYLKKRKEVDSLV